MNLALEFRLCTLDPKETVASHKLLRGLGGALAAELALAGRIRLDGSTIELLDAAPVGDPLLDPVIEGVADPRTRELGATAWIGRIGEGVYPTVHDRLIADGLAHVRKGERGRIFRKPDRLEALPAGEEPRARLRALLLGERTADQRTAVLAGLAAACDVVKLHVPSEQRKAAERRAQELAEADPVASVVRRSIAASETQTAQATSPL